MIEFNKGSILFQLHEIEVEKINNNILAILLDDEEILGAYKTVRDQIVFTSDRIVTMDVQGATGLKKQIASIPFKTIQYFSIQTSGLVELVPDNELFLHMANGADYTFEFKGRGQIKKICKAVSKSILR